MSDSWDDIGDSFRLMRHGRLLIGLSVLIIVGYMGLVDHFGHLLAFLMAVVAPSVLIGVVAFLLDRLMKRHDRKVRARRKSGGSAASALRWRLSGNGYSVVVEGARDANIVEVTIPDVIKGVDVVEIGSRAFENCGRLVAARLPRGLERISFRAFANCRSLQEVKLSARTVAIESEAFADCVSLRTIKLPKLLQTIGSRAFQGCVALEPVEIPFNVRDIARDAFPPNVKLKVYKGSAAESWAQRLGRNVHLIMYREE